MSAPQEVPVSILPLVSGLQFSGIKTLLIDVDGVLTRSIDIHAACWTEVFVELGYPVTFSQMRELFGTSHLEIVQRITGLVGKDAQAVLATRRSLFQRIYASQSTAKSGARELLEKIGTAGIKTVIFSCSEPRDLDAVLTHTGLANLVHDRIASADQCDDLVSRALASSGADPDTVLMVSSIPRDIARASALKMRSIALCSGGWTASALRGASTVRDNLSELTTAPIRSM